MSGSVSPSVVSPEVRTAEPERVTHSAEREDGGQEHYQSVVRLPPTGRLSARRVPQGALVTAATATGATGQTAAHELTKSGGLTHEDEIRKCD